MTALLARNLKLQYSQGPICDIGRESGEGSYESEESSGGDKYYFLDVYLHFIPLLCLFFVEFAQFREIYGGDLQRRGANFQQFMRAMEDASYNGTEEQASSSNSQQGPEQETLLQSASQGKERC